MTNNIYFNIFIKNIVNVFVKHHLVSVLAICNSALQNGVHVNMSNLSIS